VPSSIVLVVDDNEACRTAIAASLKHSGFQVMGADNGRSALDAVRERRPDVILMDLMMPEVDGWEAVAAIRADPAISTIPVLACTASSPDRDRIRSAGFSGCIAKPARLPALLDAIYTCCSPREGALLES
jgi:CheY-like chemotaxis protein